MDDKLESCADPESFARGGPNLITSFLVDEGIENPYRLDLQRTNQYCSN